MGPCSRAFSTPTRCHQSRHRSAATRLDPLTYGVDGLRGALVGLSQIGPVVDFAVLVAVAALFLALGARAFARIQA